MVRHIHVAVNDSVQEKGVRLKDAHDMSWEEFLEEAFDAFEYVNGGGSESSE